MKIIQTDEIEGIPLSHDADILKRVLLSENDLPASVRFSHAVFRPGQQASAHSHDNLYEVFYIIDGKALLRIDGVEYMAKAGHCIMIEPGEVHELCNAGESDMSVVYFGVSM